MVWKLLHYFYQNNQASKNYIHIKSCIHNMHGQTKDIIENITYWLKKLSMAQISYFFKADAIATVLNGKSVIMSVSTGWVFVIENTFDMHTMHKYKKLQLYILRLLYMMKPFKLQTNFK